MKRLQTLLLCCLLGTASAEEVRFGRLFFTPAERVTFEAARQNGKPSQETAEPGYPAKSAAIPSAITVNGFVRRSDGKGTVWVNGQAIQESTSVEDIQVGKLREDFSKVHLKHSGSRKIALKAGQHYDPVSGKISDSLSDSSISISTSPAR